jgi:hypothetical protein
MKDEMMIRLELLETLGKLAAAERESIRETKELQAIVSDNRQNWKTFGAGPGGAGVPIPQVPASLSLGQTPSAIDRLYETSTEREARLKRG